MEALTLEGLRCESMQSSLAVQNGGKAPERPTISPVTAVTVKVSTSDRNLEAAASTLGQLLNR